MGRVHNRQIAASKKSANSFSAIWRLGFLSIAALTFERRVLERGSHLLPCYGWEMRLRRLQNLGFGGVGVGAVFQLELSHEGSDSVAGRLIAPACRKDSRGERSRIGSVSPAHRRLGRLQLALFDVLSREKNLDALVIAAGEA